MTVAVRRNDGASGIDKITLAQVEEYGIDWQLSSAAHAVSISLSRGDRWRAEAVFHCDGRWVHLECPV